MWTPTKGASLGALVLAFTVSCGQHAQHSAPTRSPALASAAATYPHTFVGAVQNGLALFNSASGGLIRQLTTAPLSGGDQYPSLTGDGKRVYFVRATSSCGGTGSSGGIWVVSTDGGPASAVVESRPQDVDLGPIVSTDGRMLVWVRTTCGKVGVALYVRDLESGAQRVISIASDVEVAPLAWALDDRHLLITTFSSDGQSASVLDTTTAVSTNNAIPLQASPCGRRFPRFLADTTFVALTCSPTAGGKPGDALAVFDPVTGKELRVLQEGIPLPPPSDAAFDVYVMSFSWSSDGASAIWATVPNGVDRQTNVWRWKDGHVAQLSVLANEVTW